jgi:hypothetical protein
MKNFGKIISDKDIITKEYLDSKGYISAINSKMVTDALGFTPFDSAAFTKAGIKNALGIADWALAASKPSYDDVYLKLAGGTINGNLTVSGQFKAQTSLASVSLLSNIFDVNASLKVQPGWNLYLNGEAIMKWSDLKSKIAYSFSEIGSKPTTLSGYGITDAAKAGFRFDSIQTGDVNIIGWVEAANNWKGQGAGMLVGQKNYYTRINITGENDAPTMYLSRIHSGVAYDWVKVITEKNIGKHSIEDVPASSNPLPTDTRAFTTYAYVANGWYTSGPALAFPSSNYKGLIQMAYGAGNSHMRMFISGVRPEVSGNVLPWTEVMTAKNIDTLAMSLGQSNISSSHNINDLAPGAYTMIGGPTNAPTGVGDGSLLVITDKGKYFGSQIVIGWNGQMYFRGRESSAWKDWRIALDTTNIGTTSLSKINLNGRAITNWNQVRMTAYALPATTGSQSLEPNAHYTFSNTLTSSSNISITLTDDTSGEVITKIYYIVFRTGSTTPTFTFNRTLYWKDGKNLTSLAANKRYRIVIDNDLATLETYS